MKIFTGTEEIRIVDANVSCAEQFQESFATVRLFNGGNSQAIRQLEVGAIEQKISELELTIAQGKKTEPAPEIIDNNREENPAKSKTKKRKAAVDIKTNSRERCELVRKLTAYRKRLSSVRPVQVFRAVVAVRGEEMPFHMPSQQEKRLAATYQSTRNTHGKNIPPEFGSGHTMATKSVSTAAIRKHVPRICFYVRPEHLPSANYTAIYLEKQDFPSLLAGISSKLRVQKSAIGSIYYHDHNMVPVIVNELSIPTLSEEQDLIVQVLWSQNGATSGVQVAAMKDAYGHTARPEFGDLRENRSEQTLRGIQDNIFDQYLTLQDASVDSCSEFTEDSSVSMGQMLNSQCSTSGTTGSSDDGRFFHNAHFPQQFSLETNGINDSSYAFDATVVSEISTLHMSSASTPDRHLLAPSSNIRQPSPHQVNYLQSSITNKSPAKVCPAVINEQQTITWSLPSDHAAPVAGDFPNNKSKSSRKQKTISLAVQTDVKSQTSLQENHEKDVEALERNRLAAMKCRLTRKEKETKLQELSKEKMEMNAQLKQEVERLREEVIEAKNLLEQHVRCT